jgi:hypothetical protein
MKKITILIVLTMIALTGVKAQETKEAFKPSGKAFVNIYSNFHSSFSEGSNSSAFEIERAYLGYDFKLSEHFSGKINIDVGNPGTGKLEMVAYLKNAYINYTNDKFSASFGMIGTTAFKTQEENWGYRYIEKTFQDLYKMGASADLGVSASYKFTEWLKGDVIIVNGEGYKLVQADNNYKAGAGITITPISNLTIRGYYDILGTKDIQSTIVSFVGYDFGKATIGAEYNYQQNYGNAVGKDYSGFSAYATVKPFKDFKVFGRYDYVSSVILEGETEAWNLSKDGGLLIAGIEYQPVKGLKIAPNYRMNNPADKEKKQSNYFYINCDIKF